jgi:hypothetical protein
MNQQPEAPLPRQQQPMPGYTDKKRPKPDHGEESYRGSVARRCWWRVISGRPFITARSSTRRCSRATAAFSELGGIDILVNNAATKRSTVIGSKPPNSPPVSQRRYC